MNRIIPVRHVGFTVIELLVVTTIISVLIGVVLPTLGATRELVRSVQCKSNLRQIAIATQVYADAFNRSYPFSQYFDVSSDRWYKWDFTSVFGPDGVQFEPGLIWQYGADTQIHQCPSFQGSDRAGGEPYTGYNYNTSYIGRGEVAGWMAPAHVEDVRTPTDCVLFGDGQFAGGANKFMRAPFQSPYDNAGVPPSAGTQGFRHSASTTNAGFADTSVRSFGGRYSKTDSWMPVADRTGFLSENNDLYDLE